MHGDFHREQTKQRCELNDWVQTHGTGVLERIANGVANHGRRVKVSALHAHVHFNNLLCVVPRSAGIGHKDGLEETKERDGDQVANEEVGIKERQRQGHAEHHDEDVEHSLLRVHGANAHHFLAVLNACRGLLKVNVLLDEHNGSVRARHNGLRACACEPVDH